MRAFWINLLLCAALSVGLSACGGEPGGAGNAEPMTEGKAAYDRFMSCSQASFCPTASSDEAPEAFTASYDNYECFLEAFLKSLGKSFLEISLECFLESFLQSSLEILD